MVQGDAEWVKSASEQELEEFYSQTPREDISRRITFELDRRKRDRQDRISNRSMWAGIAGATAAVASAFVAVTQLVVPTSDELAEVEILRRDVTAVYKDCFDRAYEFVRTMDTPSLPEEPTEYQTGIYGEVTKMREEVWEHLRESRQDYFRNLRSLSGESQRSKIELERERTEAIYCIETVESYRSLYLDYREEMEGWTSGE